MDQQHQDCCGGCIDDNPIDADQASWAFMDDPIWKNVVTGVNEALDLRDANQTDPAFYTAVRALESTIKMISDQKGWTHGREKDIHDYIDNLGSATNGAFINESESEIFKYFFTEIQHLAGYGAGSLDAHLWRSPAVKKTAVSVFMGWITSLIRRV